jgi:hypothetical protein
LAQLIKIKLTKPEFTDLLKQIPDLLAKILVANIDNAEAVDSLKFFFDNKSRVFQYHMLADENAILVENSFDAMTEEDRLWREALQAGDRIDALKIDSE